MNLAAETAAALDALTSPCTTRQLTTALGATPHPRYRCVDLWRAPSEEERKAEVAYWLRGTYVPVGERTPGNLDRAAFAQKMAEEAGKKPAFIMGCWSQKKGGKWEWAQRSRMAGGLATLASGVVVA